MPEVCKFIAGNVIYKIRCRQMENSDVDGDAGSEGGRATASCFCIFSLSAASAFGAFVVILFGHFWGK